MEKERLQQSNALILEMAKPNRKKYSIPVCVVIAVVTAAALRDSDSEQKVPYTITLDAPDGAYAAFEETDQNTADALPGTRLYAVAPYVNHEGHVFKQWVVADGSIDVKVVNDTVNVGVCTFTMPAHSVVLRAEYDETKVPVTDITIRGVTNSVVSRTITVEKGKTFTVYAALLPTENIVDDRVLWTVLNYTEGASQIVFTNAYISSPGANLKI